MGKTALSAFMLKSAREKGHRAWFVVHRRELVKQSVLTFIKAGLPHGAIAAGFPADPRQLVQICSIQTLGRRFERIERPKLIVWDECHHVAAGSWSAVHAAFPDAIHIGLSATPERLDGRGLAQWFQCMVKGPTTAELIEQGSLAPYRLFAPAGVDLSSVSTMAGDFNKAELGGAMDKPSITGDALSHYQRLAAGKRAVVFCCSIAHSQHVTETFKAAGIAAAHVDGETDNDVRDATIKAFERGEIKVLSNVELFGEGFDLPAIEVAILLRPTQSLSLYLQQVGRALRPSPGKSEAIILDHAGNSQRFGLPDDEREWTLVGRAKRKKKAGEAAIPTRTCPKCFATMSAAIQACTFCAYVFTKMERVIEEREGELKEVDKTIARRERIKEQTRADTLEDLIALGKSRGYKKAEAWARHVYIYRQEKKEATP